MIPFNKALATFAVGIVVLTGVAPALAQGRAVRSGAVDGVSAARAAALRQCSAKEDRGQQYNWGVTDLEIYRSCMFAHGQVE